MQLDSYIGFILNNGSRKFSQFSIEFLKSFHITSEQAGIIRRLGEEEGISQKQLSERMNKDQTNVTRILDQLERKGLIERKQNTDDRRSYLTYLTDEGRKLNESILPVEEKIMDIALDGITEERRLLLKEVIDEIIENISSFSTENLSSDKD